MGATKSWERKPVAQMTVSTGWCSPSAVRSPSGVISVIGLSTTLTLGRLSVA